MEKIGKLELITKKVDLLLSNHATLLDDKNGTYEQTRRKPTMR